MENDITDSLDSILDNIDDCMACEGFGYDANGDVCWLCEGSGKTIKPDIEK